MHNYCSRIFNTKKLINQSMKSEARLQTVSSAHLYHANTAQLATAVSHRVRIANTILLTSLR